MPSHSLLGFLIRSWKGLAMVLGIVFLAACGSKGPDAAPTVTVTPGAVTVAPGSQVKFTAQVMGCNGQVIWRVEEADRGAITNQGLYTAPPEPGVYHVRVLAACDPSVSALAVVTVQGQAAAMTIEAPATAAQGSTQSASVSGGSGSGTLRWSIQGGIFEGEVAHPSTPAVAFQVTDPALLRLDCERVGDSGQVLDRAPQVLVQVAAQASAAMALHAPAIVTAGTASHTAQVIQPQAGWTYRWTITGGGFQGAAPGEGPAVTFQAGAGPRVVLTCAATNGAGAVPATSTVSAAVLDPPQTPVILAPANLALGGLQVAQAKGAGPGMAYRWTIQGGAFAGSDAEPATSAVVFTASQAGQVTLTCQAVNLAGTASGTATAQVAAQDAGQAPGLTLPAWITAGANGVRARITHPVAGFRYQWTLAGATLEGPADAPEVTFTAGAGPTIGLTCVATDPATGASATGQGTIAVVAAPEMPVIHAPGTVLEDTVQYAWVQGGAGNSFRWEIQGGAFTENAPTSRVVSFRAGAPGPLLITCRAANDAGAISDPAVLDVDVTARTGEPALEAPAWVFQGSAGNTARVLAPKPGETYSWTLQGGTLTSPAQGATVTFTAGDGPGLTLVCVASAIGGSVSRPAVAGVAVGAAAVAPIIQAAASASSGSDQVAWVQARPGERYQWSITGGTAGGPTDGPVFAYNVGQAGWVVLTCTATSGALVQEAAPFTQSILPLPSVGYLTPPILDVPDWITAGSFGTAKVIAPVPGATYTWTITGGRFSPASPDQATGATVPFQAGFGIAGPQVVLLCTVSLGTESFSSAAAVAIAPEPRVPEVVVPTVFTAGSGPVRADIVTPEPGMAYLWSIQGGTFLGGATSATGASVKVDGASAGTLSLTCQARNAAGLLSLPQTVTLQGVMPGQQPVVAAARYWTAGQDGLTASATREDGAPATFLWQIQGGAFLGGATTAQGAAVTLDASTAGTRILSCRAQDASGMETPATLKVVDIVAAPAIQAFRVVTDNPLYQGDDAQLLAQFSDGTATVDNGVGPVASGQPFRAAGPLAEAYTLTVRNLADTTLSMTLRPQVQTATTAIERFGASASVVPYGTPLTLAWRLNGTPTQLELSQVGNPKGPASWGVLNLSSWETTPVRRQTWTLTSRDPLGQKTEHFDTASQAVELLAGAPGPDSNAFLDGTLATAAWREVSGVAADEEGHVWFSEGSDATIRRINPDGTVAVVAGLRGNEDWGDSTASVLRFWNPGGLSVNADGKVRVADTMTSTIKAVAMDGTASVEAGVLRSPGNDDGPREAGSRLNDPVDIATHKGTDISFVAEKSMGAVRMVGPDGTLRLISLDVATPTGIAVDALGTVYVSDAAAGKVYRLTPTLPLTMASTFTAETLIQNLNEPRGLAIDNRASGRVLLVAETGAHRVRSCGVENLQGTVLDGSSLFVVANAQGQAGYRDGAAAQAQFLRPTRLAVGQGHLIYVADQDGTALRTISGDHASVSSLGRPVPPQVRVGSADGQGTAARFNLPAGVVEDSHGNLFVADSNNHTIRRIAPGGEVTTFAGTAGVAGGQDGSGSAASFEQPAFLAIDSQDNLYVSETVANRIRRITPAGQVVTWLGTGLARPMGLAVDDQDRLFIADFGSDRVLMVDANRTLPPEAVAAHVEPEALAFGKAEKTLYVLSPSYKMIFSVVHDSGWITGLFTGPWNRGAQDTPGDAVPELDEPVAIASDGAGGLYVAELQNQLVRRIAQDKRVTTVVGSYPYGDIRDGALPGFLPALTGMTVTSKGDLVLTGASAVFLVTAP